MRKLVNYLPTHFLIGLIVGVLLQFKFTIWQFGFINLIVVQILLIFVLLGFYFFKKKIVFTFLSFMVFIFVGIASVYIQDDRNYENYYKNIATNNNCSVVLRIVEVLKASEYDYKYKATVLQVDEKRSRGMVLLTIRKDSLPIKLLNIDDIIFTKSSFQEPKIPLNPYQFNYKDYLAKQRIHYQLAVKDYQLKIIEKRTFSIVGFAVGISDYIQKKLQKYHFRETEFSIIKALLLGKRQNISKELRSSYVDAGAIHILAISGLHIGIISFAFLWLLRPLNRLKNGKYIAFVLTVLLLWIFAFMTGLSASTVRAVTMFSFFVVGKSLQQGQFVEHSLATSMFLLLIINPLFLFDIGFQLSYLAVFGIVWLQPIFYKLMKSTTKITDYFWQLFTVSLAAQIGILPLSLFYFHQFPGLFFLSNLIVIPLLQIILVGGILVVILAVTNLLPTFIVFLYEKIVYLMNIFIQWVSYQESFIFRGITMSFLAMCAWYIMLIFCYQFLVERKPKRFIYFLSSILLLQSVYIFEKYQQSKKENFLVFHKSRKSIFGSRRGEEVLFYHNLDSTEINRQKIIQNYIVKEGVKPKFQYQNKSVFKIGNHTFLCVDSIGVYKLDKLKKSIIILQKSPKINLDRLIYFLRPIQIIADGTNYKNYINRWEKTCTEQKIPFHYTGKKGAFQSSEYKSE